jgi:hypothetical protein
MLLSRTAYSFARIRIGKLTGLLMMDASLESYAVLDTFTDLLIVVIHQILHNRNIYPPTTFTTTQKYSPPVQQSRHLGLCRYINHVTSATVRS